MLFHYEISAAQEESLNAYLGTQLRSETDPITKANNLVRVFPGGIEEFLDHHITNLVEAIVMQYPDAETRKLMQQQQELKAQIRAGAAPKRLSAADVQTKLAGPGGPSK